MVCHCSLVLHLKNHFGGVIEAGQGNEKMINEAGFGGIVVGWNGLLIIPER